MKNKIMRRLETSIYNAVIIEGDSIEETANKALELFNTISVDLKKSSIDDYKKVNSELLKTYREENKNYEERILKRWQPALDHIEMLWHLASELGQNHGLDVKEEDNENNNEVMAALANIFPKALLIVREIIILLEKGYPDGALSRWRSLHELSISAMYISQNGRLVATQYMLSYYFSSYRAALQVNEYAEKSGIRKYSAEELTELDSRCSKAEEILGKKINRNKDCEWPNITGKTNFSEMEKAVNMQHWRPYYKWASYYTHSSHRPNDTLLATSDAELQAHLIGPSNSGFVDPFQLTALTLSQLVSTYLGHAVNMDRIIHMEVFHEMANEMAAIAMECSEVSHQSPAL